MDSTPAETQNTPVTDTSTPTENTTTPARTDTGPSRTEQDPMTWNYTGNSNPGVAEPENPTPPRYTPETLAQDSAMENFAEHRTPTNTTWPETRDIRTGVGVQNNSTATHTPEHMTQNANMFYEYGVEQTHNPNSLVSQTNVTPECDPATENCYSGPGLCSLFFS